jgi:phage terminase large subunit-like protein
MKRVTRGERNIRWIEDHCIVPEGKLVGQRVRLREWQKDIIRNIYNTPTRRALISFARKNGKTALSAMILLLHTCGPEAKPNSQLFSAAQSRDQAAILFSLAAKMVRMNPDLDRYVVVRDTAKQLACKELGTLYRALSADASTAYGLSPILTVHDEIGQVKGPRSALYEALETASAAHANPLTICISTQAPTDSDLFSVLIDDAKSGKDPRVKLFLYSAGDDLDPFSTEALQAANPAYGDFQSAEEMAAMAEDARRMPSREAEYRNLILNQRVESVNPFVTKAVWDLNNGAVAADFKGRPVYAGLDLSETSDLTAITLIAEIDGQWHVRPTFWLPQQGLAEKSRKDRVPYDLWAQQGFLETTPGKAIEYSHVAKLLYAVCKELNIGAIAFDRFNFRHLKPWLIEAGFQEWELAKFVEFGQGFVSMSPALRSLEVALLNGKINHAGHPVLTMCAANATTESDPSGNRKLSKRRSRGRIDGLVCLAMALSVATTTLPEVVLPSIYDRPDLKDFF